jgi:hypothetical protein
VAIRHFSWISFRSEAAWFDQLEFLRRKWRALRLEGWRVIAPQSTLSFDASQPFVDSDVDESNSEFRYMIFSGDPELPGQNANLR